MPKAIPSTNVARTSTLPDYGGALVTDQGLNAKVQSLLPSVLQTAPKGFGGGPHSGGMNQDASSAWLTAALRARGVPIQDGQHVLPSGQVVQDPGWWTKWGKDVLIALSPGLAGWGLGAGAGGLGSGDAVAAGMPAALPGAVDTIPALAGGGAELAGAGPVLEGLATGPGATSVPAGTAPGLSGEGVQSGLLGPSMETPADVAAAGTPGASGGGFLNALKTGSGFLKSIQGLGQTAADIQKQKAAGQVSQAFLQQRQDQLAQQRAALALQAPGMEAHNSVRGDVLANAQDVNIQAPSDIPVPTISGGLRPSMFSANTRQLGGVMSRNALANQLSGSDVPPLTPLPDNTGPGNTALNGIALGSGFLNALGGLGGKTGATPNPTSPANNFPWQGPTQGGLPDEAGFDPNLDWWNANG